MINNIRTTVVYDVTKRKTKEMDENGQSIVLVALVMLALLAIIGLAVDVGLVFAQLSQLTAAVDASALAGVTELNRDADETQSAITRGAEFMHANDLPGEVVANTFQNDVGMYSVDKPSNATALGARTFTVTATWPVDLNFLQLLGFETVPINAMATAAYFPLADIYASRRVEDGALSTSNQAIFGPHIHVDNGDPFSNLDDPAGTGDQRAVSFRDRWHGDPNDRSCHYRILIPAGYEDTSDIVRIELFDPDSINRPNNYDSDNNGSLDSYLDTIVHTAGAIGTGSVLPTEELHCSRDQINPCLIDTGENGLLPLDQINLWWFARIDENRGSGTAPGNPTAGGNPNPYNPEYNTITRSRLCPF